MEGGGGREGEGSSRFSVHGSRFTISSSRFTVHDSQRERRGRENGKVGGSEGKRDRKRERQTYRRTDTGERRGEVELGARERGHRDREEHGDTKQVEGREERGGVIRWRELTVQCS